MGLETVVNAAREGVKKVFCKFDEMIFRCAAAIAVLQNGPNYVEEIDNIYLQSSLKALTKQNGTLTPRIALAYIEEAFDDHSNALKDILIEMPDGVKDVFSGRLSVIKEYAAALIESGKQSDVINHLGTRIDEGVDYASIHPHIRNALGKEIHLARTIAERINDFYSSVAVLLESRKAVGTNLTKPATVLLGRQIIADMSTRRREPNQAQEPALTEDYSSILAIINRQFNEAKSSIHILDTIRNLREKNIGDLNIPRIDPKSFPGYHSEGLGWDVKGKVNNALWQIFQEGILAKERPLRGELAHKIVDPSSGDDTVQPWITQQVNEKLKPWILSFEQFAADLVDAVEKQYELAHCLFDIGLGKDQILKFGITRETLEGLANSGSLSCMRTIEWYKGLASSFEVNCGGSDEFKAAVAKALREYANYQVSQLEPLVNQIYGVTNPINCLHLDNGASRPSLKGGTRMGLFESNGDNALSGPNALRDLINASGEQIPNLAGIVGKLLNHQVNPESNAALIKAFFEVVHEANVARGIEAFDAELQEATIKSKMSTEAYTTFRNLLAGRMQALYDSGKADIFSEGVSDPKDVKDEYLAYQRSIDEEIKKIAEAAAFIRLKWTREDPKRYQQLKAQGDLGQRSSWIDLGFSEDQLVNLRLNFNEQGELEEN